MEKQYIISERELVDLLTTWHYANCLDIDGVENWCGYMRSKKIYLKDGEEHFIDRAIKDLENYVEYKGGEGSA